MHLLDVFLLHCLLAPSAPDSPAEHEALARNQQRTAAHGRQPGLRLERDGREVTLVEWAAEILEQFRPIARALDAAHGGSAHDEALRGALALLDRPRQTPSARVLEAAQREHDGSFHALGCALGERARDAVLAMPVDTEAQRRLQRLAEASVREQREREAADTLPFEAYLEGYLALASLRV
jgi:glutamate--cysteine ligase